MKQTMKRALSLALALAMSAAILLPTAWADSGVENGNKIEVKKPDSLKKMILNRVDEIKNVYRIL